MRSRGVEAAYRGVTAFDRAAVRVGIRFEHDGLRSFLFHSVFDSADEIDRDLVHPQEALTIEGLRVLVEHLATAGYRFVGIPDLVQGLEAGQRYACLTFDDGYATNLRALPVLREYDAPVAIFVAAGKVESGERFWWDTVYVERRRRGATHRAVEEEIAALKRLSPDRIEEYLVREFGPGSSAPGSDLDRPLSPAELREIAGDPLVTIGNHTVHHVLLPALEPAQMRCELADGQDYLARQTAERPLAVAYPNGDSSDAVIEVAREVGLVYGFTAEPRTESCPVKAERRLRLGRFRLDGRGDVRSQLDVVRSRVQLANCIRRARARLGR